MPCLFLDASLARDRSRHAYMDYRRIYTASHQRQGSMQCMPPASLSRLADMAMRWGGEQSAKNMRLER